jgi:hypothetical protein
MFYHPGHNVSFARPLLHVGLFFFSLFYYPEDGNMFLRNVGSFLKDYMALYPTSQNSARNKLL